MLIFSTSTTNIAINHGGDDRVRIASGAALDLDILVSLLAGWHEIYSGVVPKLADYLQNARISARIAISGGVSRF